MKRVPLENAVAGLTPALLLAYIEAQPTDKSWVLSNGCACPIKDYLTQATGLNILTVGFMHVYKGTSPPPTYAKAWPLPEWAQSFVWRAVRGEVWEDITGLTWEPFKGRFTYTRDQVVQLVKEFMALNSAALQSQSGHASSKT